MGFMDYSVGGSDMASDAACELSRVTVKQLNRIEKDKDENCFNTNGIENVAMILDEMFLNGSYCDFDFHKYVESFRAKLETRINEIKKIDIEEWEKPSTRKEFLSTFPRILKKIDRYLAKT